MKRLEPQQPPRVSTGIPGLDDILGGGLPASRTYLVRGSSGSGKTTLALQFALEGAARGETVLYVMLTETRQEILEVSASHGWSLEDIHVHEGIERPDRLMKEAESTLFRPSEAELGETIRDIAELVEELRPSRIVIDPLSELRMSTAEPMRFRMQFLALKQLFADIGATAILVEEMPGPERPEEYLENVAHGVLILEHHSPRHGPERRRLRVEKIRGVRQLSGHHDLDILTGGMRVYPRPHDCAALDAPPLRILSTGLPSLDRMLGGGLELANTVLVAGQSGTGKSSLIAHFVECLAGQDIAGSVYLFEEQPALFQRRADGLGIHLRSHVESGRLCVKQIGPGDMCPGRLLHEIQVSVESKGVGALVLDSLNGFYKTMYDEPVLDARIRELLSWLSRRGVISLLSLQTTGTGLPSGDTSFLADTVILLRHVEREAHLLKSIAVLKRRGGAHESTVRELQLCSKGLVVGDPLRAPVTLELHAYHQNGAAAGAEDSEPTKDRVVSRPLRSEREDGNES